MERGVEKGKVVRLEELQVLKGPLNGIKESGFLRMPLKCFQWERPTIRFVVLKDQSERKESSVWLQCYKRVDSSKAGER